MSVAPENALNQTAAPAQGATTKPANASSSGIINKTLDLLSSVRFGVSLLIALILLSFLGMIIMQQEVDGFDAYYATLTPSQRLLYGSLELFNIYHAWYFRLLLLVLSLNIILASIDRFPKAWTFIKNPKLDASLTWLRGQKPSDTIEMHAATRDEIVARVSDACRAEGLRARITEKKGRTYIFAERGAWNRLGAYAVHVALLTIFTGGFLTSYVGRTGQMKLSPEAASPSKRSNQMQQIGFDLDKLTRTNVKLPFTVEATDIQQILLKKDGTIDASNTIDWLTRIRITDETGTRDAVVHLNNPYDYRGYRFFQASYNPMGAARNITLRLTPQDNRPVELVTIPRDGATTLKDGTRISFAGFYPDFVLNGARPDSRTTEYNNPAAHLRITPAGGATVNGYAFATELPDGAPVGAPVAGYKLHLAEFEKVPYEHILSIQRDPGSPVFYAGSTLLILTLIAVFFFSHQRIWASIGDAPDGSYEVVLGANTNRNQQGLEDRFKRLTNRLRGIAPTNRDDDE